MEETSNPELKLQSLAELLSISSNEGLNFNNLAYNNVGLGNQCSPTDSQYFGSSSINIDRSQPIHHRVMNSVCISIPPTPKAEGSKNSIFDNGVSNVSSTFKKDGNHLANHEASLSPHLQKGCGFEEKYHLESLPHNPSLKKLNDKRYDSFRTCSWRSLERQLSVIHKKPVQASNDITVEPNPGKGDFPAERFFDALEGPELEVLKPSEELVLPKDQKWPFLLRYPISSFSICLGVSSQAIMWKFLATASSTKFLNISPVVNIVLWCAGIALFIIIAATYLLKVILYFEAVRREFHHPIRVNFFFAPWLALLLLALAVPTSLADNLHPFIWYILMTPIFCLDLKIYGEWILGGERRLSKVANPTNHVSVVGNFVGALLGASMGLKEGPIFFFAVGLVHYLVLFVTLYQRLPTNETLPKELHPVFFLFIAVPSMAASSWAKIQGYFDYGSRIGYFVALFLYLSLAIRVNFFRGFKFSLVWWAYTVPMTSAAITTIRYSDEVTTILTKILVVALSASAALAVTVLLITTMVHALLFHDLFPNDVAIAISKKPPKHGLRKNNILEDMTVHVLKRLRTT